MSGNDEEPHLSDNAFHVSGVDVLDPRVSRTSPTQSPSEDSDLVIEISTEECPGASPFHFWIAKDKLRDLVAQA